MEKIEKINLKDIDLELLSNSRIDELETEMAKFNFIDKLDILITVLILSILFIDDFAYSEYVILIISIIGLTYAFYVTSVMKKAKLKIGEILTNDSTPPLFDEQTKIKVVRDKITEFNTYLLFAIFTANLIDSIVKIFAIHF